MPLFSLIEVENLAMASDLCSCLQVCVRFALLLVKCRVTHVLLYIAVALQQSSNSSISNVKSNQLYRSSVEFTSENN